METPITAHEEYWESAVRRNLARLGCVHDDDPDNENCIALVTLAEHLISLSGPWPGGRAAREESDYLVSHGYDAYWAWMERRDPTCGEPWSFYFDGEPTIDDRLCFQDGAEDDVLACLESLPDHCGVHPVWAALQGLGGRSGA